MNQQVFKKSIYREQFFKIAISLFLSLIAYFFYKAKMIQHPDQSFYINAFQTFSKLPINITNLMSAISYNPGTFSPAYPAFLATIGLIFKNIFIVFFIQSILTTYILDDIRKTYKIIFFLLLPSIYYFSFSLMREIWMFSIVYISLKNKKWYWDILFFIILSYLRIPLAIAVFIYLFLKKSDLINHLPINVQKIILAISFFLIPYCISFGYVVDFETRYNWITNIKLVTFFIFDNIGLTNLKIEQINYSIGLLYPEKFILTLNLYSIWIFYKKKEKNYFTNLIFLYLFSFMIYYSFYFVSFVFNSKGAPSFNYRVFFPFLPLFFSNFNHLLLNQEFNKVQKFFKSYTCSKNSK